VLQGGRSGPDVAVGVDGAAAERDGRGPETVGPRAAELLDACVLWQCCSNGVAPRGLLLPAREVAVVDYAALITRASSWKRLLVASSRSRVRHDYVYGTLVSIQYYRCQVKTEALHEKACGLILTVFSIKSAT